MGDVFESATSRLFRRVCCYIYAYYLDLFNLVYWLITHTRHLRQHTVMLSMNWVSRDIAVEEWCWRTWIWLRSFWITIPSRRKASSKNSCRGCRALVLRLHNKLYSLSLLAGFFSSDVCNACTYRSRDAWEERRAGLCKAGSRIALRRRTGRCKALSVLFLCFIVVSVALLSFHSSCLLLVLLVENSKVMHGTVISTLCY